MHELSIAADIFNDLLTTIENKILTKVQTINVEIGKLAAVNPENLMFCYEAITEGSPLQGTHLHVEEIPIQAECRNCSANFTVREYDFSCPECKSTELRIRSGKEIKVKSLEIVNDGNNNAGTKCSTQKR